MARFGTQLSWPPDTISPTQLLRYFWHPVPITITEIICSCFDSFSNINKVLFFKQGPFVLFNAIRLRLRFQEIPFWHTLAFPTVAVWKLFFPSCPQSRTSSFLTFFPKTVTEEAGRLITHWFTSYYNRAQARNEV